MNKLASIIIILLCLNLPPAYSACDFNGVEIVKVDGSKVRLADISEAIALLSSGETLNVGDQIGTRKLNIEGKKAVKITSQCDAVLPALEFSKSENVVIENIQVGSEENVALRFRSDEEANSNILFSNVVIKPSKLSFNGVVLPKGNRKISFENVTIRDFMGEGIILSGNSFDISLKNSKVLHNGASGIVVNGSTHFTLSNSEVADNGIESLKDGKKAYGLEIVKSNSSENVVKIEKSLIVFNTGNLNASIASDIKGFEFGDFSDVVTSSGIEGRGVKKFETSQAWGNEVATTPFLKTLEKSKKKFFLDYLDNLVLAMNSQMLNAYNYASLRERQLDKCFVTLGFDKEELIEAIHSIVGSKPSNVRKFLKRNVGADLSAAIDVSWGLCTLYQ